MKEWSNWSGSLKFKTKLYATPESEEELQELISSHYKSGRKLKLAAAGHSSSPLVQSSETLVNLDKWKGLIHFNKDEQVATFRTGTTVNEANKALKEVGLALFNTGDVDVQTLAGAISTGTHGTGTRMQNLSSMLESVRLITYQGAANDFSDKNDPLIMKAMRVSLGSLGVFSQITVKTKPLFKLRRIELGVNVNECIEHFDQVAEENRNVDFYWYPRRDDIKIRILNEPEKSPTSFPFKYTCREEEEGWVGDILPRHRDLKFDEMEYALPREAGMACFNEIRKRIKEKHRKEVAWRVLFRTIAADQNYISPHNNRDSVAISLHHNAGLPFDNFFNDIEPIFLAHGGRPHWAKLHHQKSDYLKALYPEWNKFHDIRKQLDPEGFFMNQHLNDLFL